MKHGIELESFFEDMFLKLKIGEDKNDLELRKNSGWFAYTRASMIKGSGQAMKLVIKAVCSNKNPYCKYSKKRG